MEALNVRASRVVFIILGSYRGAERMLLRLTSGWIEAVLSRLYIAHRRGVLAEEYRSSGVPVYEAAAGQAVCRNLFRLLK